MVRLHRIVIGFCVASLLGLTGFATRAEASTASDPRFENTESLRHRLQQAPVDFSCA